MNLGNDLLMEKSTYATDAMVVAPHHLATQSAVSILRQGGTAIEAMVAAAATIAVIYPHMNSIGGDSFWLIVPPFGEPIVIEACGKAGSLATPEFFTGYTKIPFQGPKSAVTVAGTVGGWQEALNYVSECGYQRMSVSSLLADARRYAENGFPISVSQVRYMKNLTQSQITEDIARVYLPNGKTPEIGELFRQPQLANALKRLSEDGLNSFYRGSLAEDIASEMRAKGMPITAEDLANYRPVRKLPLKMLHSKGELYNTPPPTQGVLSLAILGMLDKLDIGGHDEALFIHTAVEATKRAFNMRDEFITDPKYMTVDPQSLISPFNINEMAKSVTNLASEGKGGPGDTVWMGIMDSKGFSVSFIQSIYQPFGSGVVLPSTGILWHNRGIAFSLDPNSILYVQPGKKPFHTLNPAAARLNDGRLMIYGTQGGDGQPQTQTAVFHRYVVQNLDLQQSISSPRWIFGAMNTTNPNRNLNLEDRFSDRTVNDLKRRGHKVVLLEKFSDEMGQAGAIVRHPGGMLEGAYDPRSDGSAAGF